MYIRRSSLARVFLAWRCYTKAVKRDIEDSRKRRADISEDDTSCIVAAMTKATLRPKHGPIVAGMTGLRNLGNTCYINSVLQTLSHLHEFCDYFIQRGRCDGCNTTSMSPTARRYIRQTTIECFEHVNKTDPAVQHRGGLSGGSTSADSKKIYPIVKTTPDPEISISNELSALLRVMWSGKWAVVSPHQILSAIWTKMPFFKGYTQHDAQEFLSELLYTLQQEVKDDPPDLQTSVCSSQSSSNNDIISRLFEGQVVNLTECLSCGKVSQAFESFTDLSLDFPQQYHATNDDMASACADSCHLTDLLSQYVAVEKLGAVYVCDTCNERRKKVIHTEAERHALIHRAPAVLRLLLKRFMWGGRNSRGKIAAHVLFDDVLDLTPLCCSSANRSDKLEYELVSVVMHHGRGFGSGHYTAYCYNPSAESWVLCNDSTVTLCSSEDVHRAQAYVLVYSRSWPGVAANDDDDDVDDDDDDDNHILYSLPPS